jgi:outer membrane protein assembly factor BamE (lipoprotein component of BamABCDE complex)
MKKIIFLTLLLIISNCKLKPVEKNHGLHYLDKKFKNLEVNRSNKNDILEMLGPPSTKSNFDNDLWIYIERKHKNQSIFKLGAKKIDVNNIIILEIDNRGLLVKKDLYDKDDMNALKFSNDSTNTIYRKDQFIYNFLSSLRQKVNDPLGKRKKGGNRRDNTN